MNLQYFILLLIFGTSSDADGSNTTSEHGEREPMCNVRMSKEDEILALKIESSNSNDLELNNKCTELFASNNTVKNIYNRVERMYMDFIVSPFNKATKIFDIGGFIMNVLKMNPIDLWLGQISATKYDLYHVLESEVICTETLRHEINYTVKSSDVSILQTETDRHQQQNMSCNSYIASRTEDYFSHCSTELEFALSPNVSFCSWGDSQCYVECNSVNLTTTITGVKQIMQLVQNYTITGQNNTQLHFNMGEINATCNVTKCESGELNAFITNMDLICLKKVERMCNKSFASETYIRAEKKFIDQQINLDFEGPNKTYSYEDFKMTVVKMDMIDNMGDRHVKIYAPKLSDDDPPIHVFIPTEPFLNVSKNQLKVGVVSYHSARRFINDPNIVLKSKVIRVETLGREIKNLSNRLVINFPVNSSEIIAETHNLSCKFYDETEHKWNDMGSFTNVENSNNTVTCSYDHMTPFAVLLVYNAQTDHKQQQNPSCNSYIANRTEDFFFYFSTDLEFGLSLNVSFCIWEDSPCFVECPSVNLTPNITGGKQIMKLVENTITGQNNTQVVFNMGELNATCNVTKCESDEINAFIPSINLIQLKRLEKMCNKTYSDTYIRAEKNYIDQQINLNFEGPSQIYTYENFEMLVVKLNMMNSTSDGYVNITAPKLSDDDLPIDVFIPIESFLNTSMGQLKVGVVAYKTDQLFLKNSGAVLKSSVIRVETVGHGLKNLSKPLFIVFPIKSSEIIHDNYKLSCQFYDETEHKWDDMGSQTNLSNFDSNKIVTCSYNHTTLFGVLMQQQQENLNCVCNIANRTKIEKIFYYNESELEIFENLTTLHCKWGDSQCYVECFHVDLITNITDVGRTNVEEINTTSVNRTLIVKICNTTNLCVVRKCVLEQIRELMNNLNITDPKDLNRQTLLKTMCSELFASDSSLKNSYISAEKKYIESLIVLEFDGPNKTYNQKEFSMTVVKMDLMKPTDGRVQLSAPKGTDDDLPLEVFVPIEPFLNVSAAQRKVALVTYTSAMQFMNNTYPVFETKVIRVETVGRELKNLSTNLVINFTVKSNDVTAVKHTLSCQFYDEKEFKWNDAGSYTNLENFNNSNTVSCSYDHMTPFAVLLVDMNTTQIDPKQWKILSYITYIGCSFSSFFSAITIILYILLKRSSRNRSMSIHVSLSVAVFFLNTSFLLIEWGATLPQDTFCVIIAVTIQYSLLSCFSWMAIEAIHLYLLLIKVYNTYIKHYMVKMSLFGWGVPALLVGGSLCGYSSKPLYGTIQIALAGTNETSRICWITDKHLLYGMNITYFCLTFLFNTCILVAVTHQIFRLRCLNISRKKLPSRKDICTVLGMTFLLGMTWGLAFFTSGYTNYAILYLFCICNTLQGFCLFLWFYGTLRNNKRLVKQNSTVSERISSLVKNYEHSFTQ